MPLETERRRPDFEPGVPITLGDGQPWQFPRPKVRFRRVFRDDVAVVEGRSSFGPAFDEALAEWRKSQTVGEVTLANIALAELLLARNYDLSRDEVSDLLEFEETDEANGEMWAHILNVALGVAPKLSADGPG